MKNLKNKIKNYFLDNPLKRMRVRQIERELRVPLPSVIRYTKELVKENLLKVENISNVRLFSADRASVEYIFEKKIHNLRKIKDSNLMPYLKNELSNPLIILFGSFGKGEDLPESDIDLFIQTNKKEVNLQKYQKILGKNIQIFLFKDISLIKNKHLANNIINGTVLNGFLEVFR